MNSLLTNWQAIADSSSLWELAGWTMCYFLILGTLIALLGAALRLLTNRAAPTARYSISLAVFAVLALSPIGIAISLYESIPTDVVATESSKAQPAAIDLAISPPEGSDAHIAPPSGWDEIRSAAPEMNSEASHPEDGTIYLSLNQAIHYMPWLWLIGTPLTFALLATGLVGSEKLRRTCQPLVDGAVVETAQRLRAALGMGKRVAVAASERIAQPVLVGIFRPLVLLPSAALTGWSPEQLEMVLLHELAHVRRWDNLVNLLQRIVESLLFFHPAVWLVSRQVRRDREQCCDAIVVKHTAKPQAYAELLVSIAASPPPLAGLALGRHPLAARIRRILKLEDEPMLVSRKTLGFITLTAAALVAVALWQPATRTIAEEPTTSEVVNAESAEEKDVSADEQLYHFEADTTPSEIEKVISKLEAQGLTLHMHREDGGAITIRAKNGGAIVVEETNGVPPTGGKAPPAIPVFLPLEQQKIVDQAYKMLGVELSLPGPKEMTRAKENKFEGGLVINAGPSVFARGGGGDPYSVPGSGPFLQGDILVGLHVWPTSSLKDISTVLNRDDIAELSPLKFFVLRDGAKHPGSGLVPEVKLVTGRVPVNLEARNNLRRRANRDVDPFADPTNRSSRNGQSVNADVDIFGSPSTTRPRGVRNSANEDAEIEDTTPTLLYDGKTFDQWREMWKTELKTEKRTECIKALAAFGRAGYGKEAAEAILDVVKEYDWESIATSDTGIGGLQDAAIQVFRDSSIPNDVHAIPIDIWLPVLVERIKNGDKTIETFAGFVLPAAWSSVVRRAEKPERQRFIEWFSEIPSVSTPMLLQELTNEGLSVERVIKGADGSVVIESSAPSRTAADALRELHGTDEVAIKYLESLLGEVTPRPVRPREIEVAKKLLQELKARSETDNP